MITMMEVPTSHQLRETFLQHGSQPTVFSNCIDDWPARKWTLSQLASVLKDQTVICRIGLKSKTDVQWETDCDYRKISLQDFSEWVSMKCSEDNPLHSYNRDNYWIYVDYKYMKDVFINSPLMLTDVLWERFGFPGRCGEQSTIWIGSEGAHTVGHYDTYGCNLVAQISGRKRWILFPPDQTDCLYPTRIPFEESSVFSDVKMSTPDLLKHPKLKLSTPHVVDLEAGQVLFVPRHWWHFVECLEPAISINTWIEMPEDDEERLKEALTRTIVCSMLPSDNTEADDWLNTNQEYFTLEENLEKINDVIRLKKEGPVVDELSACVLKPDHTMSQITEETQRRKRGPDSTFHSPNKQVRLSSDDTPINPDLSEVKRSELSEICYMSENNRPSMTTITAVQFKDYMTSMLNITPSSEGSFTQENKGTGVFSNVPDSQILNKVPNRLSSHQQNILEALPGDAIKVQASKELFITSCSNAKLETTVESCSLESKLDTEDKTDEPCGTGSNSQLTFPTASVEPVHVEVEPSLKKSVVTLKTLVNCISHPCVVSLVAKLLNDQL